jgi:hypothetical protein
MTIHFYIPAKPDAININELLHLAHDVSPIKPFDDELVDFVTDFSKSILLDRSSRAYPELIVLANFFRSSNIIKLRREISNADNAYYLARGIIFHLAPSNVDSVFLYSSLLSFLCGNVNIVRVSTQAGPQISLVVSKLNELLMGSYAHFSNRFFVLTYDHNDEITTLISEQCHARVIWGGDLTAKKIRSLPLRPTALEICFPDRFSAAVINSDVILKLNQKSLNDLSSKFFNDSIWFSQQACSSPRLVAWIGRKESSLVAGERFWEAFDLHLKNQVYENTPGMVMDRFVASCLISTHILYSCTSSKSFPSRFTLKNDTLGSAKEFHSGNGIFYEQYFSSVSDFFKTLSDREQTLSVFGFESDEISSDLRDLPWRAVDRIVQIGSALDFSHIWDGYSLLQSFTRRVSLNC